MTTARDFITRQLATTGWAPIDHDLAKLLCPGVASEFRDFMGWQNTPSLLLTAFKRTTLCRARIEGFGDVLILYRGPQFLAERMTSIVGGKVELIVDKTLPTAAPYSAATEQRKTEPKTVDKVGALRALAAQELPVHDCALRRDILAAKAELERLIPA